MPKTKQHLHPRALAMELNRARQFVSRGHLHQARDDLYAAILDNSTAELLGELAVIELELDNCVAAKGLLRQAIELQEGCASFHNALGVTYHRLGDLATAKIQFYLAMELDPGSAQPYVNLGRLLRDESKLKEALHSYQQAVNLAPSNLAAQLNLANTLRDLGSVGEAISTYQHVLTLEPELGQASASLGSLYLATGDVDRAARALQDALTSGFEDAELHCDLAACHLSHARLNDATQHLKLAVELAPEFARGWYGLGCAYLELRDYAWAADSFLKVIKLAPDHAQAYHNLGRSLWELGAVNRAVGSLKDAMFHGLVEVPLQTLATIAPGASCISNDELLEIRRSWGKTYAKAVGVRLPADMARSRRLRVGYLTDYWSHANWMKPVKALLSNHDHSQFSVTLFAETQSEDSRDKKTYSITSIAGKDTAELHRTIVSKRIDILVDLNGYSRPDRLKVFSSRPAPIAVAWFNMYSTSGLESIDYLIGDQYVAPENEDKHYSEEVRRLGVSYLTFEVDYPVPDVANRVGGTGQPFVFGCLAAQYKITPDVINAWIEILIRSPDSQLLIRNRGMDNESNVAVIRAAFGGRGIRQERLVTMKSTDHFNYLQTYAEIDLTLDPFPYSGGTTTMESLWQGVPVLTFHGDRWASRTSESILRHADLDYFVAVDEMDYIDRAVAFSLEPRRRALNKMRAGMRKKLRSRSICQGRRLAEEIESQYRYMWNKLCDQHA